MLHLSSPRWRTGHPYSKECTKVASKIEDCRGFYLWGCYDKNGLWRNIHLGKSGEGERAGIRTRVLEELKDERCSLWRVVYSECELMKIGPEVHQNKERWKKKIRFEWERYLHKAGATHIAWVPTPKLSNEDILRVEADLIEAMNPIGNLKRPAPPRRLQEDTARVFRAFRQSIHEGRGDRFTTWKLTKPVGEFRQAFQVLLKELFE